MRELIRISKNKEIGIPECMVVIEKDGYFLVQTYNEKFQRWITQKVHGEAEKAIADCYNWYCGRFKVY